MDVYLTSLMLFISISRLIVSGDVQVPTGDLSYCWKLRTHTIFIDEKFKLSHQ